jgi:hypothetical protein
MIDRRPPLKLTAHPNVVDIAEERRVREQQRSAGEPEYEVMFIGFQTVPADPPPPPSHPAARALLPGLMQGWGERENDPALIDAGKRLGVVAGNGQQAAPERRWRPRWLRAVLGLGKRLRRS